MTCPNCGCEMQKGAPHGHGRYQYECRACGKIVPVYVRSIQ